MSRIAHEDELSLVEHLDELRTRLISTGAVFIVALAIAFWQNTRLLAAINAPLPPGMTPSTFGVSEAFMSTLTVSMYGALIVTLPVIFWHLYAFMIPAVADDERGALMPLVIAAPLLFLAGVAFAFFLVIPAAANFLLNFNADQFNVLLRAKDYYSFVCMTAISMGLLFEAPLAILAATRIGITSPDQLRSNRRYALVVIAAIAMLLPGTDPISMLIAMVPLLVLFEASIWLSVWFASRVVVAGAQDEGPSTAGA